MFGVLCCRCLIVQTGLSRGSPAGGSQALVTKEASNFEVSFVLRTATVSMHSLNRFCFLKAWVIYSVGERWCSVCWEKPQRGNSPCRIMCFLSFPLPLYLWNVESLDCSGEHSPAKSLEGKQEGKLFSSDKLLYFCKCSHFLA